MINPLQYPPPLKVHSGSSEQFQSRATWSDVTVSTLLGAFHAADLDSDHALGGPIDGLTDRQLRQALKACWGDAYLDKLCISNYNNLRFTD